MLTLEQKRKKQEINEISYKIQDITSRTVEQNINYEFVDYGSSIKEIRTNLRYYTNELEEHLSEHSGSLFNETELTNLLTVVSSSAAYDF